MSNVEFGGPKLYPVIHNERVAGTLNAVERVISAGADGAFLINHEFNAASLLRRYEAVTAAFPDAFIGLNFLDMRHPFDAYQILVVSGLVPDALWTDWYPFDQDCMEYLQELTPRDSTKETKLFAGVSHKAANYTENPEQSALMAQKADPYVDFVTTTGPRTGSPASLEKLTAMRAAINRSKLAVASGVNAENVGSYVPLVDAVLVATSLESSFGEIDDDKLATFMEAFRQSVTREREKREASSRLDSHEDHASTVVATS